MQKQPMFAHLERHVDESKLKRKEQVGAKAPDLGAKARKAAERRKAAETRKAAAAAKTRRIQAGSRETFIGGKTKW